MAIRSSDAQIIELRLKQLAWPVRRLLFPITEIAGKLDEYLRSNLWRETELRQMQLFSK
jgi:hypothetical protein